MKRSIALVLIAACGEPSRPPQRVEVVTGGSRREPEPVAIGVSVDAGAPVIVATPALPVEPPECSGVDVDLIAAAKAPACATKLTSLHTVAELAADLEIVATPSPGPYAAGKPITVAIELRNKTSAPLPLVFALGEFGERDPGSPVAVWINDAKGIPADGPNGEPSGCIMSTSLEPPPGTPSHIRVVIFTGGKAKAVATLATQRHGWSSKKVGNEKRCTIVPIGAMSPGKYALDPMVALAPTDGHWPPADARTSIPIQLR